MNETSSEKTAAKKVLREDAERPQQQILQMGGGEKAANSHKEKGRADHKVATRVTCKRKRNAEAVVSTRTGISQTSAVMLFRCSSQLLRQQALEYDVRAREMAERNAAQTKEIREWEKRIQGLKRELEKDAQDDETTCGEGSKRAVADTRLESLASAAAAFTGADTVESLLPSGVIDAETTLRNELRRRMQKMQEFCNSVPGFIHSQDEQQSRHY